MESGLLVKGKIPSSEPIVNIGMVLPNDKLKKIKISFSNNSLFDFYFNEKKSTIDDNELNIEVIDNKLFYNKTDTSSIKINTNASNLEDYILIDSLPVGRGFHWANKIPVKVLGNIIIMIKKNNLFVVNQLKLEHYIMCVSTSEMSSECPTDLLKSQTIAARSWVLAASEQKHRELNIDACNDDCCQRYQGINNLTKHSIASAESTRGKVLIFFNEICDARYSKSCGGLTEDNNNVWETGEKKYLQSIVDSDTISRPLISNAIGLKSWFLSSPDCYCSPKMVPEDQLYKFLGAVDQNKSYFRWSISITQSDLINNIKKQTDIDFEYILSLVPLKIGSSSRIMTLKIEGSQDGKRKSLMLNSEYDIRKVLHYDFLFSSAFLIQTEFENNIYPSLFHLKGAGWGHGVGMCQIGALGMSLNGKTYLEILNHYFPSTHLHTLYG